MDTKTDILRGRYLDLLEQYQRARRGSLEHEQLTKQTYSAYCQWQSHHTTAKDKPDGKKRREMENLKVGTHA